MPVWNVTLYDSLNRVLISSEVEADVYSVAIDMARKQRRDVLGDAKAIELELRSTRFIAKRIAD